MGTTIEPANPTIVAMNATDLEGWTSDDVVTHLGNLVLSFKRGRIEVGLLLWKLRTLEPSDTAYGVRVAPFAEQFDVTVATLGRWRQAAEEQFGLVKAVEKSKNETAGQKGLVARPRATKLDFEKATFDELVTLGRDRLMVVQKKINDALQVIRRG